MEAVTTRTRQVVASLIVVLLLWSHQAPMSASQSLNGFDLSDALVEVDEILSGGPPRDGIPSIDNPQFVPAASVNFLRDDDIVVSVGSGAGARAYPLRILVWHEIVNDVVNDRPLAVTYCPLCGTAMVFDRNVGGATRTFGVSGLLYRSDVLMYDRETESLWSQLAAKAVTGDAAGAELAWLPSEHLTWSAWSQKYPEGSVLSTDTGFQRDYGGTAYAAYFASDRTMFPVPHKRRELKNKAWVVGVVASGSAKAYPVDDLPDGVDVSDTVGDTDVIVRYEAAAKHPTVTDANGTVLPSVMVFWFAWQAFYPETEIWTQ